MKRLDVGDPKVFDKWRELYYELTDSEQEQFGYDMEAKYPHQQSYTLSNYEYLFSKERILPRVLEIGGWKGELAAACLLKYGDIHSWHNIDYCKAAVEKSVCTDKRYTAQVPPNFFWFKDAPPPGLYDIAILAHVIEHLTDENLVELISFLSKIKTVIFEAPIGEGESDWGGYQGTHILKMGWEKINKIMHGHGCSVIKVNDTCYIYKK